MKQILALVMCALSLGGSLAFAEIYIATGSSNQILVGDHLQTGAGFESVREVSSNQRQVPTRVQVYTGAPFSLGTDLNVEQQQFTELWWCAEGEQLIFRFPIAASGEINVAVQDPATFGNRFLYPLESGQPTSCDNFLVHQDHIFIPGDGAVYGYTNRYSAASFSALALSDAAAPNVQFGPLAAEGDRLYALDSASGVVSWSIAGLPYPNVGQGTAGQVTTDEAVLEVFAPQFAKCPAPWTSIAVSNGLLFVSSQGEVDGNPDGGVCVFDLTRKDTEFARLIRTLNHPDLKAPTHVFISGDELYVVGTDVIFTFDVRSGGSVGLKRTIMVRDTRSLWVTSDNANEPSTPLFELSLEEPVDGGVHSGVSNLRGWAVAKEGISRVDIFIDGVLFQAAPYGGSRGDVGAAFPGVEGSAQSGFSIAYNYSGLEPGEHTIMARASTLTGRELQASATFTATRPGQEFIANPNALDLGGASCSIVQGQGVRIEDFTIDGSGPWDVLLEWRRAAQGFQAQTYIFDADAI